MQSTERVIVRGSRQQTELAAWLADQLNQPGGAVIPDAREYKLPADEMVRVFGPMHSQTREQVRDLVTIVRSVADTDKIYSIPEHRQVALRAKTGRAALAAWLLSELDKAASELPAVQGDTATYQFMQSDDPQIEVRVFYLASSFSALEQRKVAAKVRAAAGTTRQYFYVPLGALVVRGTGGQIAIAERVIQEMAAQ